MPDTEFKLEFSDEQIQHIKKYGNERLTCKVPTILIVEDQEFSRKLMEGLLNKTYVCYSAANAREALELYAEHIPCIMFLDIELPDCNGHDFAAFIKKNDPASFIVMVTANNYVKDVTRSCENKVDGFIAKPFSKQKIVAGIEKYINERKLKQ